MNDRVHDRSEPVRLVIVDDDALVREGLRLLVGGESGIMVVGEAFDGLAAQAVIAQTQPDVVLMDVRMPRCDGLAATLREMKANPDLAILMLTTFHADDTVLEALRAGARGFLLKDAAPNELLAAVHAAAAGRPALAPAVLERVMHIATTAAEESTLDRERYERLSEREREVATLMGEGRSNAQIAAQLFVSVATVKTHVSRVLEKFEVERRTQVVAAVHRLRGIVK